MKLNPNPIIRSISPTKIRILRNTEKIKKEMKRANSCENFLEKPNNNSSICIPLGMDCLGPSRCSSVSVKKSKSMIIFSESYTDEDGWEVIVSGRFETSNQHHLNNSSDVDGGEVLEIGRPRRLLTGEKWLDEMGRRMRTGGSGES